MRAIVLVGGFGTRLRPLTNTLPKPMLPVGNVPLLARLLVGLARGGVTDATLALQAGFGATLGRGVGAIVAYAVLGTVLLTPEEPIDLPASNTCQVDVSRSTGRTGPTCTTRSEQLVVDDR